jgi:hypothetical protein
MSHSSKVFAYSAITLMKIKRSSGHEIAMIQEWCAMRGFRTEVFRLLHKTGQAISLRLKKTSSFYGRCVASLGASDRRLWQARATAVAPYLCHVLCPILASQ